MTRPNPPAGRGPARRPAGGPSVEAAVGGGESGEGGGIGDPSAGRDSFKPAGRPRPVPGFRKPPGQTGYPPAFLACPIDYEYASFDDDPNAVAVVDRPALAVAIRRAVRRLARYDVTVPGSDVRWLTREQADALPDLDGWSRVDADSDWVEVPDDVTLPEPKGSWYREETTYTDDGDVAFSFRGKHDPDMSELTGLWSTDILEPDELEEEVDEGDD